MMSDSLQDTWVFTCPEGIAYPVGEIIPVYRAAEGLIFGEEVVRMPCPGFSGAVIVNEEQGKEIILEAIQPDDGCFFVGPESQAWRWEFARKEIMKRRAFKVLQNQQMDEALGDMV